MDIQSWVTAAATVVLAGFAALQIFRDSSARKQRRRAVVSQINGTAFLLRRQLRSWLGIEPHREKGVSEWVDLAPKVEGSKAELDTAESRMEEIARLAPEVGGRISERVSAAYVLFLAATNRLATTPEPPGGEVFDWLQLTEDGEKDLRECLAALEDGPISQSLLDAHTELQERREREDPFTQLADALEITAEQIDEREGAEKLLPGGGDDEDLAPRGTPR